MYDWTQYSQLKIYPQKWNVLTLSSKKKNIGSTYYNIGERRISAVTTIDDLGISFNGHVSFERLINEKVNEASSRLVWYEYRLYILIKKFFDHYLYKL